MMRMIAATANSNEKLPEPSAPPGAAISAIAVVSVAVWIGVAVWIAGRLMGAW